jgi:hypothetical protein
VTEPETIPTPDQTASPSAAEVKPATKPKASKKAITKTPKRDTKKSSSLTDDQKRLARNAALREWRKKNSDHVKAYMTEWRAKRKAIGSEPASGPFLSTATNKGADTATKKPTSKKSKKLRKGGKA